MKHHGCRHWDGQRDLCTARTIIAPRKVCDECELYEPPGVGLGDAVEKAVSLVPLRVVKRKKQQGCGACQKRRAKLNRASGRIRQFVAGLWRSGR